MPVFRSNRITNKVTMHFGLKEAQDLLSFLGTKGGSSCIYKKKAEVIKFNMEVLVILILLYKKLNRVFQGRLA